MSGPDDDDRKTEIYDSRPGKRAKSSTRRGHHQAKVEHGTPTEVDAPPELKMISMKTPAELASEKRSAKQHEVKLRSLAEIHRRHDTPAGGLGFLAPPRDPGEVRARRLRDYVVWGSVVVIIGSAVMIGVWLLAI
jgi:hypothetical protein